MSGRKNSPSLRAERLEDRDNPSTFLVANNGDSGPGTLREALDLANAQPNVFPDYDIIQFDSSLNGQTINISGTLPVTNSAKIIGPGANLLTINHLNGNFGTGSHPVFSVDDGIAQTSQDPSVIVYISGLTLTHGGVGVFNKEVLHVENCVVTSNYSGGLNNGGSLIVEGSTISGNGGALSALGEFGGILNGNFLVVKNSIVSGNSTNGDGGGIYSGARAEISDTTIDGNFAAENGGGIAVGMDGYVLLDNVSITNNTSVNISGGGGGGGGIFSFGTLSITDSTISGNTTNGENGGGINSYLGNTQVNRSTITGNSAVGYGGGVSAGNFGNPQPSTLEIVDSVVSGNTAGGNGGGIFVRNATNLGIAGSTIATNTGGGVALDESSKATISDSSISGNTGGGIFNSASAVTISGSTVTANPNFGILTSPTRDIGGGVIFPATLTVTNSTISGNDIYGITSDGEITVTNATIVDNDTGIRNDGTAVVKNTIVAGHATADVSGTTPLDPSSANNLIGDPATAGGLTNGTNGNIVGKDDGAGGRTVLPLAEILDPVLRDNGGPTFTHKLVLGSAAIDAGSNAAATTLANDQRGSKFYRIAHTTVDIGAYEVQVPQPLAASGPLDGVTQLFVPDSTGTYSAGHAFSFAGLGTNVRTAVADVNGDSFPDTIFVTGPGVPIRVAVVSGVDHSTVLVPAFDPFGGEFTGGGFVAAETNRIGRASFAVTPDLSGGPRVVIFSLRSDGTLRTVNSFLGIDDPNFRGGARPAYGDVDGDGVADLLVAAGFGGGPRVAIFNGISLEPDSRFHPVPFQLVPDFYAFPDDANTLRNGVFAALGDVDGDGFADPIFGGGPGGAPRVYILSGRKLLDGSATLYSQPIANFFVAGNSSDRGGIRVAAKNADGDSRADVVVGSGEGSPAKVRSYLGVNFTGTGEPATFQDLNVFGGAALTDGVFVG